MRDAVDLLRRARELIGSGWTQGTDARASDGTVVDPWSDAATAWSLLGALVAALEESDAEGQGHPLNELALALDALAEFVDDESLARWNDAPGRTAAQVDSTLAAAAAKAEGTAGHTFGFSPN